MKKIFISSLMMMGFLTQAFADSKLTALIADTTAQATDLIYKVDSPSGTAQSRSITLGNLATSLNSLSPYNTNYILNVATSPSVQAGSYAWPSKLQVGDGGGFSFLGYDGTQSFMISNDGFSSILVDNSGVSLGSGSNILSVDSVNGARVNTKKICLQDTTNCPPSVGGTGYVGVRDEGSNLVARSTINFIGSAITCVDNAGTAVTDCTVTGSGGGGMIPGDTNYVQISTGSIPQGGAFRISSGTIGNIYITTGVVGGTSYTPLPDNPLSVVGMTSNFLQFNIQNSSADVNASADLVLTSNLGTNTSGYVNLGINSSSYSAAGFNITGSSDSYLYASNKNLAIGTADGGPDAWLKFFTGGTTADKLRSYITNTGTVAVVSKQFAIGGTTPSWTLNGTAGFLKTDGQTPPGFSFQVVNATDVGAGKLGTSVIASSINAAAVGLGQLSAIGTENNTTFFRGDNIFSVIKASDITAGIMGSGVVASSVAANQTIPLAVIDGSSVTKQGPIVSSISAAIPIPAPEIQAGSLGASVIASSLSAALPIAYINDQSTGSFTMTITSTNGFQAGANVFMIGPMLGWITGSTITAVDTQTAPVGSTVTFSMEYRSTETISTAGTALFTTTYSTSNSDGKLIPVSTILIPARKKLVVIIPATGSAGAANQMSITVWYIRRRDNP